MSDKESQLVQLLQQQLEQQRQQLEFQQKQSEQRDREHQEQMQLLVQMFKSSSKDASGEGQSMAPSTSTFTPSIPPFEAFDSTSELWPDYWSRFQTFLVANAVPEHRVPQVFLTNQNVAVYRQLATTAAQLTPPKDINNLTMDEVVKFMREQFDPKRFIVRERFKFWSDNL